MREDREYYSRKSIGDSMRYCIYCIVCIVATLVALGVYNLFKSFV